MDTEPNLEKTTTDIFSEEDIFQYQDATTGQRFLNYLIDVLLMRYGLSYLTGTVVVKLVLAISPETAYKLFGDEADTFNMLLAGYLIGIFNFLFYYTICEKAFRGYTLGKLITGTRAIREDGKELTFRDAILRSLSRLVPLEPLSGFGTPWHDSWTKTTVIKAR